MASDTTPKPAEQAVGSGQSALDGDAVAPEFFIPQGTRDNYAQIARDQAAIRGVEPKQVMGELADQWEQLHEKQPLDGYDHLAAWGRDFDLAAGQGPSGLAVLQARVLESARRDPQQAVVGDQALVEQGVAAQKAADERVAGIGAAPSVDPASGALPNAGPLPVPDDIPVGPDAEPSTTAPTESAPSAGNTAETTSAPKPAKSSGSGDSSSS